MAKIGMRTVALVAAGALALTGLAGSGAATADSHPAARGHQEVRPLVIGHRGTAGYRPEHTLGSYELAVEMGADYIEPDLVSTKDGVLVARHEPEIGGTTDVADHPEFAARRTTKSLDGVAVTGWFTTDFTLAELRTLRAKERLPAVRQRNTLYDGRWQVPTFQEVIDLAKRESRITGREIGIYPETKHPTFFRSLGLPLEPNLLAALNANGLNRPGAKVFVQSFEVGNLIALHRQLRVPEVQLLSATGAPFDFVAARDPRTYADLVTPAGLRGVARYAAGIGPDKNMIVPRTADNHLGTPTTLVADAHRAGLVVHPYTFRNENQFLPVEFQRGTDPNAYGNVFAEYALFFRLGVDGVFSDNSDTAIEARKDFLALAHRPAA
jgi:glycerophosphoryl diester phosphodiesterase